MRKRMQVSSASYTTVLSGPNVVPQALNRPTDEKEVELDKRLAAQTSSLVRREQELRSDWEFLTPRQVAEMTGLHVAVVRRAIERGELRAYKLCSRLRIGRNDFEAWLERNVVRS